MGLKEKINHEFVCFFLEQMSTSKENIFAHTKEIEIKKNIRDELYLLEENIPESTAIFLASQNNILESVYCYCQEIYPKKNKTSMEEVVGSWVSFLLGN